jgi:hypothetical protein
LRLGHDPGWPSLIVVESTFAVPRVAARPSAVIEEPTARLPPLNADWFAASKAPLAFREPNSAIPPPMLVRTCVLAVVRGALPLTTVPGPRISEPKSAIPPPAWGANGERRRARAGHPAGDDEWRYRPQSRP